MRDLKDIRIPDRFVVYVVLGGVVACVFRKDWILALWALGTVILIVWAIRTGGAKTGK